MQFSLITDYGKLDLTPSGAFARSFVHDGRGDPHASFHFAPNKGNEELTWHLTRRRQKRVWLPAFHPTSLWAFIEQFERAMMRAWLRALEPIDLERADREGWRVTMCPPPKVDERMIREEEKERVEMDLTSSILTTFMEHTLAENTRPLDVEGRGPEGPTPFVPALRWKGAEIVDAATWGWLEYGAWDAFALPEPIRVHPPGWYRIHPITLTRQALEEMVGTHGMPGVEEAIRLMATFFGPVVREMVVE